MENKGLVSFYCVYKQVWLLWQDMVCCVDYILYIEGEKKIELGSKPPEYSIMTRHGVLYRLQYI